MAATKGTLLDKFSRLNHTLNLVNKFTGKVNLLVVVKNFVKNE